MLGKHKDYVHFAATHGVAAVVSDNVSRSHPRLLYGCSAPACLAMLAWALMHTWLRTWVRRKSSRPF